MPVGRLLILEDDPGVAKILHLIGRSSGLEGRFVADAKEFLKVAGEWSPTHIALDLIVPDSDGEEVLGELARRGCPANIIITSGMGERVLDAAMHTAVRRGLRIVGILAKPFSTANLRTMLAFPTSMPLARAEFEALRPRRLSIRPASLPAGERKRSLEQQDLNLP